MVGVWLLRRHLLSRAPIVALLSHSASREVALAGPDRHVAALMHGLACREATEGGQSRLRIGALPLHLVYITIEGLIRGLKARIAGSFGGCG